MQLRAFNKAYLSSSKTTNTLSPSAKSWWVGFQPAMNEQWYLWFIKSMNMGRGFNKETLGLNMSLHYVCCNLPFLIACSMQKRREKACKCCKSKPALFWLRSMILLYCSAINLCEYKIMQIGQFWRL